MARAQRDDEDLRLADLARLRIERLPPLSGAWRARRVRRRAHEVAYATARGDLFDLAERTLLERRSADGVSSSSYQRRPQNEVAVMTIAMPGG